MVKFGLLVLLIAALNSVLTEQTFYKNYKIYNGIEDELDTPRLKIPGSKRKLKLLKEYRDISDNVIKSYLVAQSPDKAFSKVLKLSEHNISVIDLEESIQENVQRGNSDSFYPRSGGEQSLQTNMYYSYDEMNTYLRYISSFKNPDNGQSLAVVDRIGRTYQGRDMFIVKISSDHSADKPIIFFEAGIHAREWTAPAAMLYTISQLVENYTYTQYILNNIDFYIIPLSNPDGYEYSRTKERFWRKTRSKQRNAYGVDGNRNFDFHWDGKGSSTYPKSDTYRGPYPFSEVETRNIRDVGIKYKKRIYIFVSVHAYAASILYPWSYALTAPAPHSETMHAIAQAAADAIKKYSGTIFNVGVSSALMYDSPGGSDDYFKGVLGVDFSFTIELSAAGEDSFVVPPSKLFGITSEAFEGFKVMAKYAVKYASYKD